MFEDYNMTHQPFHHLPRTPADLKMTICVKTCVYCKPRR